MNIEFVRATQEDRDAAASILNDAAYARPQTLQAMREGTEALVRHSAVRQAPPEVQVLSKEMGGVTCEVINVPGADTGRAILYIHGGAFIRGSLALGRANAALFALLTGIRVVAVGYRQAPEHPYPAAPTDVRKVYESLLAEGIVAGAIAVAGESSGGCLALGLAADLHSRALPLPAAIAALSPMTDLALPGASWVYNHNKDVASREVGRNAIAMYIDTSRMQEPVASPIGFHFKGCCPLFIGIGSHETMLSDAERLAHHAESAGVSVDLHIYEDMPHGFTRFESAIGTQAIRDAAQWCGARLAGQ
jgi:epsilon-lactone hydrolase